MRTFGLIVNEGKENAVKLAQELLVWFKEKNMKLLIAENNYKNISYNQSEQLNDKHLAEIESLIVLGGDGTLLGAARKYSSLEVPIIGINLGHLGFLTSLEVSELYSGLEKLLKKEYIIENRMMLECSVIRDSKEIASFISLNDIVITKGAFSRMVKLKIFTKEDFIDNFSADGIIIATPTGSTAYSLSAGGPIISPDVEAIVFAPICPHTLYSRPIIISPDNMIKVVLDEVSADAMLTADGQYGIKLEIDDEVLVRRSKYRTQLIRFSHNGFFNVLRKKMRQGN